MANTSLIPRDEEEIKLSPKMRKWVTLVATGEHSDTSAYKEAYKCTQEVAEKNAWRLRRHAGVLKELLKLRRAVMEAHALQITASGKRGRLAEIMMHGNDADSIRAIKELNAMELRELAMGGGEETEFSRLLLLVAERRRVLPKDDEADAEYLTIEA